MSEKRRVRLWLARLLIGVVILWNLQAAFAFFIAPERSASAFELAGVPGQAAVRGVAVLFVMWNVPYLVACWQPRRNRLALGEALGMQAIGLVGEGIIRSTLGPAHSLLAGALLRFIAFDSVGLALLIAAFWVTRA